MEAKLGMLEAAHTEGLRRVVAGMGAALADTQTSIQAAMRNEAARSAEQVLSVLLSQIPGCGVSVLRSWQETPACAMSNKRTVCPRFRRSIVQPQYIAANHACHMLDGVC